MYHANWEARILKVMDINFMEAAMYMQQMPFLLLEKILLTFL